MIPILFSKSEPAKGSSAFKTNGIGRLTDAVSCTVTKSLDGGQYDLEMQYPVSGVHYDNIEEKCYIYASVSQKYGPQPFRIYKISKPIKGTVTVYAEHISYILKKTLIRPYRGESQINHKYRFRIDQGDSLQTVLDNLVSTVSPDGECEGTYIQPAKNNRFTFVTDSDVLAGMYFDPYTESWVEWKEDWGNTSNPETGAAISYEIDKPLTVQEFLTGSDTNSVNSIFGFSSEYNTQLEYVFDGFTVGLYERGGEDAGVQIRYGKNLTDMTYETDRSELYSSAIPYYSGSRASTTIIAPVVYSDGADSSDAFGEMSLVDLSSSSEYVSYLDSQDTSLVPDPDNAAEWVSQMMINDPPYILKENVTISFIDLWKTEEYADVAPLQELDLGDTVTVVYSDMGVNVKKRVQNETWDCLVDRYTSMTLGDLREDLKTVIIKDARLWIGELTEYVEETNTYYSTEIDKNTREIALRAYQTTVDALGETVDENSAAILVNSNAISSEVTRASTAESSIIKQLPDTISLNVNNQYSSAGITITLTDNDGDTLTSSGSILMSGMVTFANLAGSGTTTINGDNITTGTISATYIDTDNLTVKTLVTDNGTGSRITIDKGRIYLTDATDYVIAYGGTSGWLYMGNGWNTVYFGAASTTNYYGYNSTNIYIGTPSSTSSQTTIYGGTLSVITSYFNWNGYTVLTANNWSSYISIPDLSGYATQTWVNNKGYLTSHQSLSNYPQKSVAETITNYWTFSDGLAANQSITVVSNNTKTIVSNDSITVNGNRVITGTSSTNWTSTSGTIYGFGSMYVERYNNDKIRLVGTYKTITDTSDRRLKDNIVDLPDLSSIYMELQPKQFTFKPNTSLPDGLQYGLVAQEVRDILLKYGYTEENTGLYSTITEYMDDIAPYLDGSYYSMNYDSFHAMHIQMIQKQQNEIETLKSEVFALKGEIDILKQMLKEVIQNGNN